MNGKHPLDELFARGLGQAEVTPPPAVWRGVVQQRGIVARSMRSIRQSPWTAASAALLVAGLAGFALFGVGTEAPGTQAQGHEHRNLDPAAPTAPQLANATDAAQGPSSSSATRSMSTGTVSAQPTQTVHNTASEGQRTASVQDHFSTQDHLTTSEAYEPEQAMGSVGHPAHRYLAPLKTATAPQPSERRQEEPETFQHSADGSVEFGAEPAIRLDLLTTSMDRTLLSAQAAGQRNAPQYVRPTGHWTLGAHFGPYSELRTWHGRDVLLAEALNGTEARRTPKAYGVSIGHRWANGLELSTGLELIANRYDFLHTQYLRTEQEVVESYYVTLDSQVLWESHDTTTVVTEEERAVRAVNRYTTWRVPVQLAWMRPHGRWEYGPVVGAAVERTTFKEGSLLTTPNADTQDMLVDLPVAEMDPSERTSHQLSAQLGFRVGYALAERLQLHATPSYSAGITMLGSSHELYPLARRAGISLGFTYTIPR